MRHHNKYHYGSRLACISVLGLLLAACGGSDGGTSGSLSTIISGVAATGAPLAGGTVELSCKDGLKKPALPSVLLAAGAPRFPRQTCPAL